MQPGRLTVYAVAGFVALVALLTGPHVGVLGIPEGGLGGAVDPGTGTASVEVLSGPEVATLEPETYGDVHYLRIPDATVDVSSVSGAPLLTLSLDIPELGFQRSTVFTIARGGQRTRSYGVSRVAIESNRIDRRTYEGQLRIVLQDDRGRTVLYEEPITIRVTE